MKNHKLQARNESANPSSFISHWSFVIGGASKRRREDPIIDSAIRKALCSRLSSSSANCPDDNALAAYLEQKLSLAERARLEDHASTCVQCQEVLALSLKLDETEG